MVLVEHDNGVRGQRGWTEEPGTSLADVEAIKARYADSGIIIYEIERIEHPQYMDQK